MFLGSESMQQMGHARVEWKNHQAGMRNHESWQGPGYKGHLGEVFVQIPRKRCRKKKDENVGKNNKGNQRGILEIEDGDGKNGEITKSIAGQSDFTEFEEKVSEKCDNFFRENPKILNF